MAYPFFAAGTTVLYRSENVRRVFLMARKSRKNVGKATSEKQVNKQVPNKPQSSKWQSKGLRQSAGKPSKYRLGPVLLIGLAVLVVNTGLFAAKARRERADAQVTETVKIEMEKGTIVIEVYPKLMPVTSKNFLGLAKSGFYDGIVWHRVEDWVVQTGDPQGTGCGGSGKTIKLETTKNLKNIRGAVAMARSMDPDSASSQFYVLKTDAPWLDGDYAVFGKVVSGMDVIDSIEIGDKMLKVTVEPK